MHGQPFGYERAIAVNLSADFPIPSPGRAQGLYIGVGGTIKVDTAGGDIGVTLTVLAGHVYLAVTKIYMTGTTATNITALI